MEDWLKQIQEAETKFWQVHYPALSFEERLRHWADTLGKALHTQEKGGHDPYAVFSPEWYQSVSELEPEIYSILERVFRESWNGRWNWELFLERIGK